MTPACTQCRRLFLPTPDSTAETLCHDCRPAAKAPVVMTTLPIRRRRKRRSLRPDRDEGIRKMQLGGFYLTVGLLVTFLSYAFATSTGGYFLVASGAIIFGGFRFISGLLQYLS